MYRQRKGTRAGGQPCHFLLYRDYYTEI